MTLKVIFYPKIDLVKDNLQDNVIISFYPRQKEGRLSEEWTASNQSYLLIVVNKAY